MDRLFRRSAGRLLAGLTRFLGTDQLALAEDVVQDALLRALQTWPYHGIPANPQGWLFQVARRRALDVVRRSATLKRKLASEALQWPAATLDPEITGEEPAFADDELTMMFLSCHPALTEAMRVGLTLKAVAGFGIEEIAAAFLVPRPTMQQRLVRAKRILRRHGVPFRLPPRAELPPRLDSVLRVLYLVFNEGYGATAGDSLIRSELCTEAIRLTLAVVRHPATDRPEVHALLALMYLQASRLRARTDELGGLVLLEDQDRSLWNAAAVTRGLEHLQRAACGDRLTTYHLEAGVASCHAIAPSVAGTDWVRILDYYDQLQELDPSPIFRLNRAVALAMLRGDEAGIAELNSLRRIPALRRYHLLPAVRGRLLERAGRVTEAARDYGRALALARTKPERAFLTRRLANLGYSAKVGAEPRLEASRTSEVSLISARPRTSARSTRRPR
jgi:RNA polymerase sigma-70 factor (ECF subfamily)